MLTGVVGRTIMLMGMLVMWAASVHGEGDANRSFNDNVMLRGSLDNARLVFERTHKGHVAFIGGSITEMNGYRPRVCEILKRRFPNTEFTFTNAGISSTCSTTGAFRLATDVLAQDPVDLLFVEFAVNDDQDAHHTRAECIRGMEGIVRHALRQNPNMNLVITHFVNPEMLQTLQSGKVPLTIEAHEAVADHYGISTINLAREVAGEITTGTLTWDQYGGTHPGPAGNALCASMIDSLFDRSWSTPLPPNARTTRHSLPNLLDPFSYTSGHFIDPKHAVVQKGWTLEVPDWKKLPGATRERFTSIPMLCATEPGAEATLDFTGTVIGAYIVAGPDAGIAEASIDGGPFHEIDLYHTFSRGLHYPRTVLLGSDLKPGKHRLTLRMTGKTRSSGHAMRIIEFAAN